MMGSLSSTKHSISDAATENRSGWFSASGLAKMALPGLPAERARVSNFIVRMQQALPDLVRLRAGRGGGLEISELALPDAARAELARRAQAAALSEPSADAQRAMVEADQRQIAAHVSGHLTARQRRVMDARATVLLAIDARGVVGGVGRSRAIAAFLDDLGAGRLDDAQRAVVIAANDKPGQSIKLSRATLYNWFAARERAGSIGLAPQVTRQPNDLPPWFDAFLKFWRPGSKVALRDALRNFSANLPEGAPRPTERQVRLALSKLPVLERLKGREGRLALRSRMAYTARTFDDLMPTSVYAADGKTFDAEIAHPIHGQPFRPEITTIIDVATRRIVGWSAALDEHTFGVVDALRMACERAGIPAIFYTDRGRGYRNQNFDAPLTGFLGRAGITAMRALPYNSQAKGVVERVNQIYTAPAKSLPTYMGKDMDKEAKLVAYKTTRRDLKTLGTSNFLPSWAEFLDLIGKTIADYNNRPHTSLPKIRDAQLSRMRHETPNEAWARKCTGFDLVVPDRAEIDDMFRPYVTRITRRALVEWLGNQYFAAELEALDGTRVVVGYDIHDASKVWVREIDEVDGEQLPGRLIAIAAFNGHATRYVPLSFEQAAMERRNKGRLGRLQSKIRVVEQELAPPALLELSALQPFSVSAPAPGAEWPAEANSLAKNGVKDTSGKRPRADASAGPTIPASQVVRDRPMFVDDVGFARWCHENPERVTDGDRSYLADLIMTHSTNELLRMSGVDLVALRSIARSTASHTGAAETAERIA